MTAAPEWGPGSGANVGGMTYAVEDERRSDITRKAGRRTVARLNFLSGEKAMERRPESEIGVSDLHKQKLHSFL